MERSNLYTSSAAEMSESSLGATLNLRAPRTGGRSSLSQLTAPAGVLQPAVKSFHYAVGLRLAGLCQLHLDAQLVGESCPHRRCELAAPVRGDTEELRTWRPTQ
jgi:hypothetical protein